MQDSVVDRPHHEQNRQESLPSRSLYSGSEKTINISKFNSMSEGN